MLLLSSGDTSLEVYIDSHFIINVLETFCWVFLLLLVFWAFLMLYLWLLLIVSLLSAQMGYLHL